jgi:hypothetical protein
VLITREGFASAVQHPQFRTFHVNLDDINLVDLKFVKYRIEASLLDFNRILPTLIQIWQQRVPTALVSQV